VHFQVHETSSDAGGTLMDIGIDTIYMALFRENIIK